MPTSSGQKTQLCALPHPYGRKRVSHLRNLTICQRGLRPRSFYRPALLPARPIMAACSRHAARLEFPTCGLDSLLHRLSTTSATRPIWVSQLHSHRTAISLRHGGDGVLFIPIPCRMDEDDSCLASDSPFAPHPFLPLCDCSLQQEARAHLPRTRRIIQTADLQHT
ncbi:hypothetical protein LZ32DRAFT_130676 [Colletotrichum eremochloae]|nr:hypothetical protein LZ32DRAFT_130676 [Colletotrichum eremochloae]